MSQELKKYPSLVHLVLDQPDTKVFAEQPNAVLIDLFKLASETDALNSVILLAPQDVITMQTDMVNFFDPITKLNVIEFGYLGDAFGMPILSDIYASPVFRSLKVSKHAIVSPWLIKDLRNFRSLPLTTFRYSRMTRVEQNHIQDSEK